MSEEIKEDGWEKDFELSLELANELSDVLEKFTNDRNIRSSSVLFGTESFMVSVLLSVRGGKDVPLSEVLSRHSQSLEFLATQGLENDLD